MILVIGGAYQGKYDFVKHSLNVEDEKILNSFHIKMKKWLDEGKDPQNIVNEIFDKGYEVIISDEIGCGIVPLERNEREWREASGRALCCIAERCSRVWRVHCGIGIKIKG